MVKFLNLVPWAGAFFCHAPNAVIDLDDEVAEAREAAGLGKVVKDKSIPSPKLRHVKPEPTDEVSE